MGTIPNILALLTLCLQVITIGMIFIVVGQRFIRNGDRIMDFFARHAMWAAFLVALAATLGSLYYSEILGLSPCRLCWFQRIFIYPQSLILLIALVVRDKKVWRYIIALSSFAIIFSAYQYYIQINPPLNPVCSIDAAESCSTVLYFYYGYITIPLMALTAGVFNFLMSVFALRKPVNRTINID